MLSKELPAVVEEQAAPASRSAVARVMTRVSSG